MFLNPIEKLRDVLLIETSISCERRLSFLILALNLVLEGMVLMTWMPRVEFGANMDYCDDMVSREFMKSTNTFAFTQI